MSTSEAVLGKDESCDLVLDDVSLAGKHISLSSDGSGADLTLLDTEKPIYIDGKEFSEKTIRLTPFQVIRIGTLLLAVGPADAEWPPIDTLSGGEKKQTEDNNVAEKGADGEAANRDNGDGDDSANGDARQTTEKKSGDLLAKLFPQRYLPVIGAVLGSVAFVVLIYLLMRVTPHTEPPLTLQPEKIDQVMQIANQYGAQIHIKEPVTHEGIARITGYINTELDRRNFISRLKEIHIHVEVKIISSEEIMHTIDAVIDQFRRHNKHSHVEVVAVANSPGDFVLKGYVQDKTRWLETMERLKRDVKDYRSLKDEIQTQEDRVKALKQMLSAAQLGKGVEISVTEENIVLSGKLNPEEQKRLAGVKEDFNRKFNSAPEAVLSTEESTDDDSSIKLDIRAIGFGGRPHIIMGNGQRYTEGAQLNNGYTITRITQSFIELKKGDKTEFFYLNSD